MLHVMQRNNIIPLIPITNINPFIIPFILNSIPLTGNLIHIGLKDTRDVSKLR